MNNKFIKRVAAVVLGVAVLSTCAFAASVTNGYRSEKLYFTLDTTEDKVSYIAYASDAEEATGEIVAIGQIDNDSDDTESISLPISTSLLGDASHILIKSGDSAGNTAKQLIPASAVVATVVVESTEPVQGEEYTVVNAPACKMTVEFKQRGSVVLDKLTATADGKTPNILSNIDDLKAKLDGVVYDKDGSAVVNFFIAGAPEDYIRAGINLDADCTFTPAN